MWKWVCVLLVLMVVLSGQTVEAAARPWWQPAGIARQNVIGAYQAVGVTDLSLTYIDLTGHGNTLTPGLSEPQFTTEIGWHFTGQESLEWLDTGIIPQPTWTIFARVENGFASFVAGTATNGNVWGMGLGAGNSYQEHARNYGNDLQYFVYGARSIIGISNNYGYWNGFVDGPMPAISPPLESSLFIGAINMTGEGVLVCYCDIGAVVIFDIPLTQRQIFELTNKMVALPDNIANDEPHTEYIDLPSGATAQLVFGSTVGDIALVGIGSVLTAFAGYELLRRFV